MFLLKAMVAYDELGSLVPIKRTLQVIDYQNQANKESEVSRDCMLFLLCEVCLSCQSSCTSGFKPVPIPVLYLPWACGVGVVLHTCETLNLQNND